MNDLLHLTLFAFAALAASATEFHVAITGSDAGPGTRAAPLRTIQRAADLAQPGDTVTVHAGVYREYVNPPPGGESDAKRIVYQAAAGEKVVITGSEEVKNWENVQDGVWKATLPNTFFGSFNPFAELSVGDWFDAKGRNHLAGGIDLNPDFFDERKTPFHKPHSTEIVALHDNPSGDNHYYNNLFMRSGSLEKYDHAHLPMWMDGNVYFQGTKVSKHEKDPIFRSGSNPGLNLVEKNDSFYLTMTLATALGSERPSQPVTSARLGKPTISGCAFENPDGSPITIGTDYFGKPRNTANPTPGPFEAPGTGTLTMKVWPLDAGKEAK